MFARSVGLLFVFALSLCSVTLGQAKRPAVPAEPKYYFELWRWPSFSPAFLELPAIQKELKLTAEQKTKLADLKKALADDEDGKAVDDAYSSAKGGRIQGLAIVKIPAEALKRWEAKKRAALDLLDDDQRARIDQVVLQQRLKVDQIHLFRDDRVLEQLAVTPEQKELLARLNAGRDKEKDKTAKTRVPSVSPAAYRKRQADAFVGSFTPEQAAVWKKMLGAPFTGIFKDVTFLGIETP